MRYALLLFSFWVSILVFLSGYIAVKGSEMWKRAPWYEAQGELFRAPEPSPVLFILCLVWVAWVAVPFLLYGARL